MGEADHHTQRSVLVVVIVVADGGRLCLLADALAGLGHHVGHLQPRRLRCFLGPSGAAQAPLRRGYRGLVQRGLGQGFTQSS